MFHGLELLLSHETNWLLRVNQDSMYLTFYFIFTYFLRSAVFLLFLEMKNVCHL